MKNKTAAVFLAPILLLLVMTVLSCAGDASARADDETAFSDIQGKEWILEEVRSPAGTVRMDRKKLEADGMGGVYTLSFADRLSGMGAPNRYFGPYTAGAGKALTIGELASTMMMTIKEPDGLKEKDYFTYLSNVTRWDLRGGKLELHSSAGTVLVFAGK
ncbi:hypothetical protein AGMMS50230_13460 [Spirochaetia bacterium]|nr:hypothetical protein AGMMS50230_13460 [Spirochaetia bacterium]